MKNTKKYIFIVQVTRQLSIDIINSFIAEGAEVELLTGIVEPNYAELDTKVKVKVLNKYNSSSGFKRIFTWSIFTIRSWFYVLFSSKEKELILVTTPPFIVFIGLFFKKIRKQKYHLVIWDLYPDVLINFGVLNKNSIVIKLWKKLNRHCFNNADTLFTLGVHLSKAIEKYTFQKPTIISNWVNSEFIKPIAKKENSFALKYNLQNKFVVMYSGNLGLTHDIESIVEAAEELKNDDSIHFVIIGEGPKKEKIIKTVNDKQLKNVLILPYQDNATLPFSLTSADIGVVTLSPGAESISVPSKTYYTLAAGSAIFALVSKESELAILIKKYDCGFVFDKTPPEIIAQFISQLSLNKDELEKNKQNARKASFDFTPKNAKIYYDYICNQNK